MSWIGDHPRSRGVYVSGPRRFSPIPGSSPLARGLPNWPDKPLIRIRIIPARAGFTSAYEAFMDGNADHPRSRGVYTCGS